MQSLGNGTVFYDRQTKKWTAKIPVGLTVSGNTAYRRKSALTKREAQALRLAMLAERATTPSSASLPTFQTYAEHHLATEARQEIRPNTADGYLYNLQRLAFPKFGDRQISVITSSELSAHFSELRKHYSASQVNQLRAAMSRVFQSAQTHQLIADNPVRRTKPMRKQEGDRTLCQQPWSLDECRYAMRAAMGTHPHDLFTHLAILTGARLGEILGLQWSDINFSDRTISIKRSLSEQRGRVAGDKIAPTFSPPKTAKSVRILSFGEQLRSSLERHKVYQDHLRENAGEKWVETDCLFTTRSGTPVWLTNFSDQFRKFQKSRGLRVVNIHSIRHSFAINALSLGIDLPSISRALGHASLQITLDIYAREASDLQNAATEGLAEWFQN